jgi:hypothetical protein
MANTKKNLFYTSLNVRVETEIKNPLFRSWDRPKSSIRTVKHLLIYVRWEALFWISVLQYDNITYRLRLNTYLSEDIELPYTRDITALILL